MKKISKTYRWIIQPILVVAILLAGFIGAMNFSMFEDEPRKSEKVSYAPLVRVIETEVSTQQIVVHGNGTLQARTRINIVPQVGGRITYIHPELRAGGKFKANEVLIEIERIDYELAVTQNEAEVAGAHTALELEIARAEAAREEWQEINPGMSIPTLVGREPQIAEAKAELESAQARLTQARLNLERTRIRMPFAGRVVEAMIDVGEVISANQQVGVVYGSERFEIPIPLEIEKLAWIDVAQKGIAGSTVKVHVNIGAQERELHGEVTRIESELQEISRFARVVVTLLSQDIPDDLNSKVIPGLFVDVSIISKQFVEVTTLPRASLRRGDVLWTIDKGQLRFIEPNIVYKSEKEIVVRHLKQGTQVVMNDLAVVTEGMNVRVASDT